MKTREVFLPSRLTKVQTIVPGEIRKIQLTLPREYGVGGKSYPIRDRMRPGSAFLAKPLGIRTGKWRRRMYTRSNCSLNTELVLETIINDTHKGKADTSPWWQTEEVEMLYQSGGTVDVRVDFDETQSEFVLYENSRAPERNNLRLEPDEEWKCKRFLALAFGTGITPFLAHVQYMKKLQFGGADQNTGSVYVLVASARTPKQLLEHQELLALTREFPQNFHYYPVLTREWPDDWNCGRGRIVQATDGEEGKSQSDVSALLELVPDIHTYHVMMCGNSKARDELDLGFRQSGQLPLSYRAEVW